MHAARAVLIFDTKLNGLPAVQRAVSRHALVEVKLTICLSDWLCSPMLLSSEQGDLALVALTDKSQQLPQLFLSIAKQPVPLPIIVTVNCTEVFIVEAACEGHFSGSTWVDATSDGVDAALHHVLDAGARPLRSVSVIGPESDTVSLSVQQAVVLCLLAHGLTGQGIGRVLDISAKTVSSHKRRIMDKLAIDNLPDLIRVADHNWAGLWAVAESALGADLHDIIRRQPACIEPTRLQLKRAPDRVVG